MKCVLHIGTEKTGTTLLQDWMYHNQKRLSDQRIYLSNLLGKSNNRLFAAYFQGHLDDWARGNNINTLAEKARCFEGFLRSLSEEIKTASVQHDVFLITSEHLHSRVIRREELDEIKSFLDQHFRETYIVCYFRNQADMAVSLYSTALRVSSTATIEAFLEADVCPENYYYNFNLIADNWSTIFGKDYCIFRVYDRKGFYGGDIRMDFIRALPCQVDAEKLDFSVHSRNESLHRLSAIAYRKINDFAPYWDATNKCVSKLNIGLKEKVDRLSSLKRGTIDGSKKRDILELFEKSNEEFFQKYFGTPNQFRPPLNIPQEDETLSVQDAETVVGEVFGMLMDYMGHEGVVRLFDSDASTLRDIAIKIEKRSNLTLSDAYALMLLAQRARPSGPLINEKCAEYAVRLEKQEDYD